VTRRALIALLATAGCARHDKRRVAVIPKGRTHIFWQSVHAGAEAAAQESGLEIIWNGPSTETDFTGQLQIVEAMINQRVDAIVLAPIDKRAMVNVVDRAAREKIPVVIFDSSVDTENFVSQVATDNYAAGQAGAERMAKILGGRGRVAMVAVQPGSASTMLREEGFEDAVAKKYPEIKILDKRYGMADFAKSLGVTENMLTAHPDLDALFASNESSTVGAAQALKGRKGKVRLVGFDSSPTLIEDLETGLIDSLVVQDPFRMGHDSVVAAVKKLDGGTPEKIQNLPPLVVTKENLNDPAVQKQLKPDLDRYLTRK
jgi:ribose transport system substrate-binding protein